MGAHEGEWHDDDDCAAVEYEDGAVLYMVGWLVVVVVMLRRCVDERESADATGADDEGRQEEKEGVFKSWRQRQGRRNVFHLGGCYGGVKGQTEGVT